MLKQRILTALVLAPIAIACIFFLPANGFSIFIAAVLGLGAWEWANLSGYADSQRIIYALIIVALMAISTIFPPLPILILGLLWWMVAFYLMLKFPDSFNALPSTAAQTSKILALIGVLHIVPSFVALTLLKQLTDSSFLILLLFFLIWGADVGAYFSGRAFGKHKLAPKVSPGKSWEGFWGGLLLATGIAIAMIFWLGKPNLNSLAAVLFILACMLVVVISVLGDLVESMFKRHRGIKDSSQLLPGHGGILDRVDSLLAAAPLFALLVIALGWQ